MIDRFRSLNLFAKIIIVLIAVFALIVAAYFSYTTYKDNQLKEVADSIEVPADWELKSSEFSGNYSCLDQCRSYKNEYITDNLTMTDIHSISLPINENFQCIEFKQLNKCQDIAKGDKYNFGIFIRSVGERYEIGLSSSNK